MVRIDLRSENQVTAFHTYMLMLNDATSNVQVNLQTCQSEVLDPDLCVGTEYVDSGRSSPTGRSRTCRSRPGHEDADSADLRQLGEDLTYVLSPGVYPIQLGSRTGPGSVTLTVTCLPTFLPAYLPVRSPVR